MNNHTTIQINGQPVGITFAMPCVTSWFTAIAKDEWGILIVTNEDGARPTVEGFAKLLQFAYKNYCFIKEVEPTLTYEDFYNYSEENNESEEGLNELTRVYQLFNSCTIMKKLVEAQKKSPTNGELISQ